jgi:hypothetical protein
MRDPTKMSLGMWHKGNLHIVGDLLIILCLSLRSEDDPYLGFTDCATRIIHEEGYGTLLRAWWLVALSLLFTGIAK